MFGRRSFKGFNPEIEVYVSFTLFTMIHISVFFYFFNFCSSVWMPQPSFGHYALFLHDAIAPHNAFILMRTNVSEYLMCLHAFSSSLFLMCSKQQQ